MNKTASNAIKYSLSLALAGILVFFAFRGIDWGSFWSGLVQTRWGWIVLFFAASVAALLFRTLRWIALLKPLGGKHGRLLVWDANNIGNLANIVIPGSGEFIRCGYLAGGSAGYEKVLGTAVTERICDFAAVLVLFVAALAGNWAKFGEFFRENILSPATGKAGSLAFAGIAVVLLVAAGIWAIWHFKEKNSFCGKVAAKVEGFAQGVSSFAKMEHKWLFLLYTAGIWFSYVCMSYCILKAMPGLQGFGWIDALFLSAVGNVASVIPVPGGIGAYHYLIALVLSTIYGVPQELGLLNATLNHEFHAVLIVVLGIISYARITLSKKNETDSPA